MNTSILDVLIGNIKEDQMLLNVTEARIEEAKEEKRIILERLKDHRKDMSVLLKYADEKQRNTIESLGIDLQKGEHGLNAVATIALEVLMKAKNHQMTNEAWYTGYVSSLKDSNTAVTYTEFNIKCRPLFHSGKVIRKKGNDEKSSRSDMIALNQKVFGEKKKDS